MRVCFKRAVQNVLTVLAQMFPCWCFIILELGSSGTRVGFVIPAPRTAPARLPLPRRCRTATAVATGLQPELKKMSRKCEVNTKSHYFRKFSLLSGEFYVTVASFINQSPFHVKIIIFDMSYNSKLNVFLYQVLDDC